MKIEKRIFKFRVWDTKDKEYFTPDDRTFFSLFNDNRFIIQQFTGQNDDNGKEIYEGDILKDNIDKNHFRIEYKQIIFKDGSFKYQYKSSHWADTFTEKLNKENINILQLEIVGNIFETPELLNANK